MNKNQFEALMAYSTKFNLGHLPLTLVIGLWLSNYDFGTIKK